MPARIKSFGAFWYDFIVGDDWRIAAGVIAALLITWAVSRTTTPAWWITPVAVAALLPFILWRAVSTKPSKAATKPSKAATKPSKAATEPANTATEIPAEATERTGKA